MKLDVYFLDLEFFLKIKEMLLTTDLEPAKLNKDPPMPQCLLHFNGNIFMFYTSASGLSLTFCELQLPLLIRTNVIAFRSPVIFK